MKEYKVIYKSNEHEFRHEYYTQDQLITRNDFDYFFLLDECQRMQYIYKIDSFTIEIYLDIKVDWIKPIHILEYKNDELREVK